MVCGGARAERRRDTVSGMGAVLGRVAAVFAGVALAGCSSDTKPIPRAPPPPLATLVLDGPDAQSSVRPVPFCPGQDMPLDAGTPVGDAACAVLCGPGAFQCRALPPCNNSAVVAHYVACWRHSQWID